MGAQVKSKEIVLDENHSITYSGYTETGNFYILERAHKEDYKTRYSVWNDDFKTSRTLVLDDKVDLSNFDSTSESGAYFTYQPKAGQWELVSDGVLELNGISEKDYSVYHELLTDGAYFIIGKEITGKKTKFFSEGTLVSQSSTFSASDYLVKKVLGSEGIEVHSIETPENCYWNSSATRVLDHDDSGFWASFVVEGNDTTRTYKLVRFSYQGKPIETHDLPIEVLDPANDKFAIANLENGSFTSTTVVKRYGLGNTVGSTDTDNYSFATDNAKGHIKFDPYDHTVYIYAGIKPKRGDSGILIKKFDMKGNLLWQKQHTLEDTSLHYINSANRYLSFDVYQPFIGVSVNSTKGTNYCDFYVLDKDTGAVVAEERYKRYGFYSQSRHYNGLSAEYEIKTDAYKNLKLERSIIYTALYDRSFQDYLEQLNATGEYLFKGIYTPSGFNTISSSKKGNVITFQKFKI